MKYKMFYQLMKIEDELEKKQQCDLMRKKERQ
jgi:hypothetical protein